MVKDLEKELFELSHKREDNLVTPLVCEYYELQMMGFTDDYALELMKNHYANMKNQSDTKNG